MLFITLVKLRGAIDEEFAGKADRFMANPPPGIKIYNIFYTLGRFDLVIFYEAPSEKEALMSALIFSEKAATETLVAIPREERPSSSKDLKPKPKKTQNSSRLV